MLRSMTLPVLICLLLPLPALGAPGAKVSLLDGSAEVSRGSAKPLALKSGSALAEGDVVQTKDKSRMEIAFADGSVLRLGANTKLKLTEARFGADKQRNVSVSVWVGRLWANVAKALGAKDTFEVETQNAVAGVRGTSFAVQASADLSAVVRVYAGTVGVRKGEGGAFGARPGSRKQVPGPQQIDKKQWEEIIAMAMKQVKVTALGDISPASDFEDTGEELEWAQWNQGRDKPHP